MTKGEAKTYLARYELDQMNDRLGGGIIHRNLPVKDAVAEYVAHAEQIKAKSAVALKTEKNKLSIFARRFGEIQANDLDPVEVSKWYASKKYQYNTARLHRQGVREVYRYLISKKYIKTNPADKIQLPKMVRKVPRAADPALVEKVLARIPEATRPPYLIMYYAGLRPSECMRLRFENIDLERRQIDLYPDQTKTAERGAIPISDKLFPALEQVMKGKKRGQHLFPSPKGGQQRDPKNALKRACAALKLGELSITPYQLRHTFATQLLEKTGDIRAVQQLLRHTDIKMTTRYATAIESKLRDAVNKL